jgi:hypothetical protein
MSKDWAPIFVLILFLCAFASPAWADTEDVQGLHAHTDAGVRLQPFGLRVINEGGYRLGLFDSTSQLLRDTHVDAGVTTNLSPVSLWAGAYVEVLPVQVLELRASVEQLAYFGSFGHLSEVSRNQQGRFEIPVLDEHNDITSGKASLGVLMRLTATPRIKIGNFVALAETTFGYLRMDDVNTTYYEPILDVVLEPTDTFWEFKPTGGFVVDMGEHMGSFFYGLRYEHTVSTEADFEHDVVLGVLRWTMPRQFHSWGHPKISLAAGGWLKHSMRRGEPYIAVEVGLDWGAGAGH